MECPGCRQPVNPWQGALRGKCAGCGRCLAMRVNRATWVMPVLLVPMMGAALLPWSTAAYGAPGVAVWGGLLGMLLLVLLALGLRRSWLPTMTYVTIPAGQHRRVRRRWRRGVVLLLVGGFGIGVFVCLMFWAAAQSALP